MNKQEIIELLRVNDRAVERAVVAIFRRQTEDEKVARATKHSNGVGFNGPDSKICSYYANWVLSGRRLTGNHLDKCRERMYKYAGQLEEIAASRVR